MAFPPFDGKQFLVALGDGRRKTKILGVIRHYEKVERPA
jgi:hypothetical protein